MITNNSRLSNLNTYRNIIFYPYIKGKELEDDLGLSYHLKNRIVGDYLVIAKGIHPPTYAVFDTKETFLQWHSSISCKEKNFFEVLLPGSPRRLYWDFDWNVHPSGDKTFDKTEKKKCEEVIYHFIKSVIEEIFYQYNIEIDFSQFLIKSSHGITEKKKNIVSRKYSWHLILPSLYFNDPVKDLPALNLLVLLRMKEKFTFLNEKDWKTFPDPSVYKSTQLFRLAESTKFFDFPRHAKILKEFKHNGEKNIFNWDFESSFIGLYKGDKISARELPSFNVKVQNSIDISSKSVVKKNNKKNDVVCIKNNKDNKKNTKDNNNQSNLILSNRHYNYTLDDIEQILNHICNDGIGVHYDVYLKVGMGLHHFFEGESNGLVLWNRWSKRSSKYDEKKTERDYNSFKLNRDNPITISSIISFAKEENPNVSFDFSLLRGKCSKCCKFTKYSELTQDTSLCNFCITKKKDIVSASCLDNSNRKCNKIESSPQSLELDDKSPVKSNEMKESRTTKKGLQKNKRKNGLSSLSDDENIVSTSFGTRSLSKNSNDSDQDDTHKVIENEKRSSEVHSDIDSARLCTLNKKRLREDISDLEQTNEIIQVKKQKQLVNSEVDISLDFNARQKNKDLEELKQENNESITFLQFNQPENIINDLIIQKIKQEEKENYHELNFLTCLRLESTQVCNIEYFVNQFQKLKDQKSKSTCDRLFNDLVKTLAKYVIIMRHEEITLWMLKYTNENLSWYPFSLESIRKKFSKTSAKIFFEVESKEKKTKLTTPISYSLIDALLSHDWRITASFISNDATKPLMYIQKFQKKDHLYFNTVNPRKYSNKEIIQIVENEVSIEKIQEAHEIWEEILNESVCNNDELSKKILVYWASRQFIEEPKERTRASPMLTGLSGTGKSSFFEWTFKTPFGSAYVKRESPSFNLGFMEEFIGKQLVFLDEVKINSSRDYNVLKNLVTSDTTALRAMYKSAVTVHWNGELALVANDKHPIKFESQDERRFKKIRTSDKRKGPKFTQFWDKAKELSSLGKGLMWAYFLVKPLEDLKYKEEIRTFNFDNVQVICFSIILYYFLIGKTKIIFCNLYCP